MKKNSRLVYSTDQGRIKPEDEDASTPESSDGIVRVSRETKGRNGKGVTLVSGLGLAPNELKAFAKKLKQVCGTGGTAKDGRIEIQGDKREKILEYLEKAGYKAKRAGG